MRSAYEQVLADMLRMGVAEGAFDVPDEKVASMAIIAMLTGVNTWFRKDGRLSLQDVQDTYWQMVARMVSVGGSVPS